MDCLTGQIQNDQIKFYRLTLHQTHSQTTEGVFALVITLELHHEASVAPIECPTHFLYSIPIVVSVSDYAVIQLFTLLEIVRRKSQ